MTAPFDWARLAYYTSYIYRHEDQYAAAAYLRERIEAEFVPVEQADDHSMCHRPGCSLADIPYALASCGCWGTELRARAEAAEAKAQRLDYSTTHTCWDECPRVACAQRREIEALRAELAEARAAERAADADPVRDTKADSDGDDGA